MKILSVGLHSESHLIFEKIFTNQDRFFDVDFANFIPQRHYYDAIIAEDSMEEMRNQSIPIFLLNNSLKLIQDNIFINLNNDPVEIKNKMISLYHDQNYKVNNLSNIEEQHIYKDIIPFYSENKKIILNILNNNDVLYNINQSLNNYSFSKNFIQKVHLILCDFINESPDNKSIKIVIEIEGQNIKLFLPKYKFLFSPQIICNNFLFHVDYIEFNFNI